MGPWLLGGVAIVYLIVMVTYLRQGRFGMALAFLGYAAANIGFVWDIIQWSNKVQ